MIERPERASCSPRRFDLLARRPSQTAASLADGSAAARGLLSSTRAVLRALSDRARSSVAGQLVMLVDSNEKEVGKRIVPTRSGTSSCSRCFSTGRRQLRTEACAPRCRPGRSGRAEEPRLDPLELEERTCSSACCVRTSRPRLAEPATQRDYFERMNEERARARQARPPQARRSSVRACGSAPSRNAFRRTSGRGEPLSLQLTSLSYSSRSPSGSSSSQSSPRSGV